MTGLLTRLIVCPIVVYISFEIFKNHVYYPSLSQILIVGIVLAIAGYAMEVWLLERIHYWSITGIDFIAATMILYLSSFIFPGANITFFGALVTALFLAFTEVTQLYYKTDVKG